MVPANHSDMYPKYIKIKYWMGKNFRIFAYEKDTAVLDVYYMHNSVSDIPTLTKPSRFHES
jgi:hypothetical protein